MLMVAGVPLSHYALWADPGPPYGEGHLASVCGNISRWTPGGQVEVRVTTKEGLSNGVTVNVVSNFIGITGTSARSSDSSTDKALESVNRLRIVRKLSLSSQQ